MNTDEILEKLKSMGRLDAKDLKGMERYGINTSHTLGVISTPVIIDFARQLGKDHDLAKRLWETGYREARILAFMIDDPARVTSGQMDKWVGDFDSWDICDGTLLHLFSKCHLAIDKAFEWASHEEEFIKRAGFVMMACLAVGKRKVTDVQLAAFLPVIERGSTDERNFVKKAVNWALRQIGKRNSHLNSLAVKTGQRIKSMDSKSARWIAADALSELTSEKVQLRLSKKSA
ncbi:MAG: DNA alkylation repair protein [Dehalococcoidia bacterium]|nr:MAG: DNA alkylation repair protein [Dehalococcoidia bacterium]